MGLFQGAALLRVGVDKLLKSDAVTGALQRRVERYVEILDLGCAEEGGVTLLVRPRGFSEEVRIVLRRAEIGDGGAWIRPLDIFADREGVDALLKDMVQGKQFTIPSAAKPFVGMLKSLFA